MPSAAEADSTSALAGAEAPFAAAAVALAFFLCGIDQRLCVGLGTFVHFAFGFAVQVKATAAFGELFF